MIVEFTVEASVCAYYMVCNPARFWTPDKWFQDKSPTEAKETGQLHAWVDLHCREPEKKNELEPRKFLAFKYPMPKLLVRKLKEHVDHYRKTVANQKHTHFLTGAPVAQESLNSIGFAHLDAILEGKPIPAPDDGLDAEDLAFLAGEKAKTADSREDAKAQSTAEQK